MRRMGVLAAIGLAFGASAASAQDKLPAAISATAYETGSNGFNQIVEFFERKGRAKDLVLYACTSGYPVAFGDIEPGAEPPISVKCAQPWLKPESLPSTN